MRGRCWWLLGVLAVGATSAMADPPTATSQVAASGVLGRAVAGPDGTSIGRLVDVLVDANGQPRAAVIDIGGFLGVGNRRIALDWADLTFPPSGSDAPIRLDVALAQIRAAPEYTSQTAPAAVVEPKTVVPKPIPPAATPPPAPGK